MSKVADILQMEAFRKANIIEGLGDMSDVELRNMGFEKANFINKGINIRNDLQIIAKKESPSVKKGLALLSDFEHMLCYSMSGSGPSCYAVFENINIAKKVLSREHCKIK